MRWTAIAAAAALALGGCAAPINEVCTGYGFRPGTDAFANCMQNEVARRTAVVDAMRPVYTPLPMPPNYFQRPQPTTTHCYRAGDQMWCQSN